MKVSCITPTGDRPEALKLCERWLQNQTRPPDEWIVVDDGQFLPHVPSATTVIKLGYSPGRNTQRRNLLKALEHVREDIIFFIEDDDYYSPLYIETLLKNFEEGYDAVGEIQAVYYNVYDRRYRRLGNVNHATLSQTAIKSSLTPLLIETFTSKNLYNTADIILWEKLRNSEYKLCHIAETPKLSIGIKGMPGRMGIGIGHKRQGPWVLDSNAAHLMHFLGKDGEAYLEFYRRIADKENEDAFDSER